MVSDINYVLGLAYALMRGWERHTVAESVSKQTTGKYHCSLMKCIG